MHNQSIEAAQASLREWASDRLNRVRPPKGCVGRDYRLLSTDWFGLLSKCYWRSEQLLKQVADSFYRLPSVKDELSVKQATKGKPMDKMTMGQTVAFMRDSVPFASVVESLALPFDEQEAVLGRIRSELFGLKEFVDRRNEFTHDKVSGSKGKAICVGALSSCIELCDTEVVALAVKVEQQVFES